MPWKAQTPMSQREDFVQQASQEGTDISALCRGYGISRKTGYKWLGRYRSLGPTGLADQSRRPQHAPTQTPAAVEQVIIQARQQHPAWGARKLKAYLEQQGQTRLPSTSTVHAILQRHGLIEAAEAHKHRPYQRFERAAPNELWQMDFKGAFALDEGGRCYPLTVLDDHSRFLVGLHACANQQTETVQQRLTGVFQEYGLPERMLMDNGSPWGDDAERRWTRFTVWLLRLGIGVTHGRPYHPQTQGKDERLHRTLQAELLSRCRFASLADSQPHFDNWRWQYNYQRPHQALSQQPPASRYQPSPRPFPERLPELVYPDGLPLRRVDAYGKVSFRNRPLHVGRAFAGEWIALHLQPDDATCLHFYFGPTCVGEALVHVLSSSRVTYVPEHL